jgi:hypothetical protein
VRVDPPSPTHPLRRVIRWVVIALLAAALFHALRLLAGA